MINKYRSKDTVEAVQVSLDNYVDVARWCNGGYFYGDRLTMYVYNMRGCYHARVGDWVVRDATGYSVVEQKDWELLYEQC